MTTLLCIDRRYVTDGGLETDLIFHHGVDLPEFARSRSSSRRRGARAPRAVLRRVRRRRPAGGRRPDARSPDLAGQPRLGQRLGYDAAALDRVNRDSISFLHERATRTRELHDQGVLVGGMLGPRGDGYVAGDRLTAEEYADYHRPQLASFQAAGADLATALTLVGADEAIGIVAAARDVGLPIAVSFTVETDGRLAGGHLAGRGDRGGRRGGRPGLVPGQLRAPDPRRARAGGRRAVGPDRRPATQRQPDVARRARRGRGARRGRPRRAAGLARARWCPAARPPDPRRLLRHRRTPCRRLVGSSEKLAGCPPNASCTSSTRSPS